MIRSLVISFLRSSFKEDMRHQLDGPATAGTAGAPSKKRVNPVFQAVARLGGKLIGPRTKTRIQGYLINKFDVPLSFVPPDQLVLFFEKAVQRLSEAVDPESVGDYLEFGVYQGNA